ncbi:putative toxin-antitoxin system toxin component, PIN family [Undibacterium luofuense]|uniref:putative toxin-antitoxin system toxin component, PIN family n=1 Tax=Undibacterium luofuense TaxID=2828733 RepID=UPI001E6015B7|nr:putative toxin-antitoxin system toxin component, PIN family [Undibacterium luofuense]
MDAIIPKPVVLDTNVCLDLFLFQNPAVTPILDILSAHQLQPVTSRRCRNEWLAVLKYPHLKAYMNDTDAAIAHFDALIQVIEPDEDAANAVLPQCKDKDDQKFVVVAAGSQAIALVSKDKALLKLNKRLQKSGRFPVLTPADFIKRFNGAAS